ncbi:Glyoxylase, beta-lactamase superfamily II [Meinhardsimonia xiamenensis]|jgi:glyoxylase-like metal-dependent hydrolase (beta-lactamase superfamily II)|uniref:Glyoxylase, beta-lactamase superfamily II n=1 Tax=Meinhardsimonia xiamenensis TaxID=990712 RepID=A0A1G9C8F8_9RHOB|nr:MBL fold metallo-hydrolase [Meinhardsimonia xiamenensis]PRX38453.1 glyoxylase-like metal-dependent hydrolase (beta-lactamase superfamily II) [Meinhardsimonia xiamenensis]SDK47950.1 Glyoxylase, beta-lactamase superfamily II [Meinhardsimonia xiamenensis]
MNARLTRRAALASAAALPLAATLAPVQQAGAAAHGAAPENARKFSFQLGAFRVSTILAGSRAVENPQTIFGLNVSPEEFAAVSTAAFLPTDKAQFFFTPTVVDTGSQVILFDTGLAAGGTLGALAEAGYGAEDVDLVIITHMHGDHIGGLMNEGAPTFPNATYVTGQVEFDAWAKMENERFEANMRPLAERTRFVGDGQEGAPGITAVAAFGHTPGHMAWHLESEGQRILVMADTANHYVWSLAHPDWEVRFDMDKAAAAATRRRILGMVAAERIPLIGYHMPFPGIGYVETRGDGFAYVPHSYQLLL